MSVSDQSKARVKTLVPFCVRLGDKFKSYRRVKQALMSYIRQIFLLFKINTLRKNFSMQKPISLGKMLFPHCIRQPFTMRNWILMQ
jgi:hypothetical protein